MHYIEKLLFVFYADREEEVQKIVKYCRSKDICTEVKYEYDCNGSYPYIITCTIFIKCFSQPYIHKDELIEEFRKKINGVDF